MTEDDEETRPAVPSRNALAASTLRALRAGRGSSAPASSPPAADASADADPAGESGAAEVDADTEAVAAPPVRLAKDASVASAAVDETPVDETPAEPVDEAPSAPVSDPPAARSRRGGLLTAACAVLAAAALVFAVVAGVIWWTAGHSDQRRLGLARDAASTDARLAIVTVNTSDYRHPATALSNWLDVSTGALHTQFSQSRTAAVKLLAEAKTVTRATVLGEAVTSVNVSKGTASVLASVNVTRVHAGKTSTVRNRFRATLARVDGQWKLSNLTVVAVALS